MKVLAIGAGAWGRNIVKNLHALGVLAGICDVSDDNLAKATELAPGVPTYHLPEEAYDAAEFDAVAVATPAPLHFEIAAVAMKRGMHCFVEKPLTLSAREADALVQVAAEQERVLMAGHLLLFQPAVEFLREQIRNGAIGELVSLHQERLNLGRARSVENVLWSLGVHDVAVALYLVGENPTAVQASGLAALTEGVEDDVYLHIDYPSGVKSHLHSSWLWPSLRRRTTVIGTDGMLVYNETEQQVVLHRKRIDGNLASINDGEEVVFEGSGEPLKLELEHFLNCVRTGATPKADGVSAAEVIRVLEAANPSELQEPLEEPIPISVD